MPGAKHTFSVNIADDASAVAGGLVLPSHWNAEHTLSDLAAQTSLDAVSNAVSVVSNAVSIVSTAASNALSVANAASNAASIVSQAVSVLSQAVSVAQAALSVRVDTQSQGISVLSVQAALVDGQATHHIWEQIFPGTNVSIIQLGTAGAIEISSTGGTASVTSAEADIISNAVSIVSTAASNALSVANAASNAASIVSTAASNALSVANAASNAASNALSVANAASNAASIVSTAASNALSVANAASNAASIVSTAASNALSVANAVSQRLSAASVKSVGGTSVKGFQSVLDALSNRISAGAGGSATPTSAAYVSLASTVSHLASIISLVSAVSGAGTAVGLQSVVNALSNRISAIPGGASAPTTTRKQVTQEICVSVLTEVLCLSVSVSAGAIYEIEGVLLHYSSAGLAPGFGFGVRGPAFKHLAGQGHAISTLGPSGGHIGGLWDEAAIAAVDSILVSSTGGLSGVATRTKLMKMQMYGLVSTTGTVTLTARTTVGTNTMFILPGSFLKATKQ